MENAVSIEIGDIHGNCPVCGTSWVGITYEYDARMFLQQKHPNMPHRIVNKLAKHVPNAQNHFSRLLHVVDDKIHLCPDCHTYIKIKDYPY